MAEVKDNKHEGPQIKAETWFSLALSAAAITIIIGCMAALWVFSESEPKDMVLKAQAFTPFGAALLAIVTFCTIAWRGVLNTQQLEHQAAQLRQQIRQNDANDDANLAKLLQEGAKLLADREKLPQVIAGIATLEILIKEPNGKYAIEAMDLLGDLLLETYGDEQLNRINRSALRGLAEGADRGLKSRVEGTFMRPEATGSRLEYWVTIRGLSALYLTGGALKMHALEAMRPYIRDLDGVLIESASVDADDPIFSDCTFKECTVTSASVFTLRHHTFLECDFSDAVIKRGRFKTLLDADLKSGLNFYHTGREPRDDKGQSLASHFYTKDEIDEIEEAEVPF